MSFQLSMVWQHLSMVLASVLLTLAVGLPIGLLAYLVGPLRRIILNAVAILQTIPSLALLGVVLLMLGPGRPTVVVGLLLYALLPVVHNTYLGLSTVEPAIKEAANGMGMSRLYRLFHVEIPIAFPMIFTGVRIAVVTSIGVAVIATFVGGGGLGAVIHHGIRVQNMTLILSGTLTLMAMAVLFDSGLGYIEKRLHRRSSSQKNGKARASGASPSVKI